jgi:hypothetical protein
MTTGRLLAAGGTEIEGAGVQPDARPTCDEKPRAGDDCLLRFAEELVTRSKDPQRATLVATAKALAQARP